MTPRATRSAGLNKPAWQSATEPAPGSPIALRGQAASYRYQAATTCVTLERGAVCVTQANYDASAVMGAAIRFA